jgi:hypothetical protein
VYDRILLSYIELINSVRPPVHRSSKTGLELARINWRHASRTLAIRGK